MGLFKSETDAVDGRLRCPQCREWVLGDERECSLCGADLREARDEPGS